MDERGTSRCEWKEACRFEKEEVRWGRGGREEAGEGGEDWPGEEAGVSGGRRQGVERKREKRERSDGLVVDTYVCMNSLISQSLWSGLPIS